MRKANLQLQILETWLLFQAMRIHLQWKPALFFTAASLLVTVLLWHFGIAGAIFVLPLFFFAAKRSRNGLRG